MTIKECIDIVDNIKPNQYTVKEKVGWLSFIDEIIINDVLKTHEGYDGRYDDFEGYSENKLSASLIVPSPYDRLYTAYLKMKIDGENGEMARYNNSAELFNTYMMEYRKHYNKTHMPLDVTRKDSMPKPKQSVGTLPESVIENITRELYAMLSEDVAEQTSEDRIYSIVTSYMQNNAEMLKGKDGKTPEKGIDYVDGVDGVGVASIKQTVTSPEDSGSNTILVTMTDGSTYRFYVRNGSKGDKPVVGVDYYTPEEKSAMKKTVVDEVTEDIEKYVDDKTEAIRIEVDGIQKQINEEAHFRGYLSTNAKIQALEATPNDFAYSAESNTKWIYDEVDGWKDTGVAVPDQLTPASNSTPLMDGAAEVGNEEAYARGDHRHPSDTTKEDKTNKKADAEFILDFHNHNDYPTTRAVHDYVEGEKNQILRKVDWELIESVTLAQDVQKVICNINSFYKELYIRFTIPTMNADKASDFPKARTWVYVQGNVAVYDDAQSLYADTGTTWVLSHHITMIGNMCVCERKNYTNANTPYIIGNGADRWGHTIGTDIGEPYIDSLSILMYPQTTRLFPAGTTYELWGVRA